MTKSELLAFMRGHRLAVQATVTPEGGAQAAVVGIVVTDALEVVFDSVDSTRKVQNLRQNPRIALVIGGWGRGNEREIQYEGIADEPSGEELTPLKELYLARFPDGYERLNWPGLTYIRCRPTWIRYSDWTVDPPVVEEFEFET
ncbi:MAG TPA: pyridoxamine 5'-phosphate oxidase family protein [Thermoanaerobaculia bacterium]|nr:pyridoxamine 5'-phosphate oxidase family protein [Thermoanaerobaculia bacterium]